MITRESEILYRIGQRIATLRKVRGISQQDLAARCNFEKSNMSRIEAGRSNLTVRTLCLIGQALEVPIADLVDVERSGSSGSGNLPAPPPSGRGVSE